MAKSPMIIYVPESSIILVIYMQKSCSNHFQVTLSKKLHERKDHLAHNKSEMISEPKQMLQ